MTLEITSEALHPHPAVETAFFAPEAVLWDSRHHRVHRLNASASAVWLCIDGELTADQIATELSEVFQVPRDVIRPDVDTALTEFVRLGLLDGHGESQNEADAPPADSDYGDDQANSSGDDGPADATVSASNPGSVTVLARPPDP